MRALPAVDVWGRVSLPLLLPYGVGSQVVFRALLPPYGAELQVVSRVFLPHGA